jgi:hypothetical protein
VLAAGFGPTLPYTAFGQRVSYQGIRSYVGRTGAVVVPVGVQTTTSPT